MRAQFAFVACLAISLSILTLFGCRASQTNLSPQLPFVAVDVRVVDNTTTRPVAGAMIYPICLGGTPYATNTYSTDSNGFARVVSFASLTAVRVTKEGYQEAAFAFFRNNDLSSTNAVASNAVVKLKRVEK